MHLFKLELSNKRICLIVTFIGHYLYKKLYVNFTNSVRRKSYLIFNVTFNNLIFKLTFVHFVQEKLTICRAGQPTVRFKYTVTKLAAISEALILYMLFMFARLAVIEECHCAVKLPVPKLTVPLRRRYTN